MITPDENGDNKTVITPKRSLRAELREIAQQRQLLWYFVRRNFKVRYKQSLIGVGWAILQPLILMIVFTVLFNQLAGIEASQEAPGMPYAVFSYAGLLYWTYFSQTLSQSSTSLVVYQGVIKKIYFPRLMAPLSTSITGLADFFFASLIYVGLLIFYGIAPSLEGVLLFLPMLLLSFVTVFGLGMLLASINIKYRDVQQALPFFIQAGMFITPVIYPVELVPERFEWVLFLNPMTGVIETARAGLLELGSIPWANLGISVASALFIFIIGLYFFRRREAELADWI